MIRQVSIGVRLSIALGFIVAMVLLLGVTGILKQSHLNEVTETIVTHRLESLAAVNEINESFLLMRLNTANLLSAQDESDLQRFNSAYAAALVRKNEVTTRYGELIRAPGAQVLYEKMNGLVDEYERGTLEMRQLSDNGLVDDAALMLESKIIPVANNVTGVIRELVQFQTERINASAAQANATYKSGRFSTFLYMFGITGAVVIAAFLLTRSIIFPIREAVDIASKVAQKNLTSDILIAGKDEVSELLMALSKMQTQLRDDIGSISSSAEQLASASEELSSVTKETNVALQTQNNELEQAASAMTQLTVSIEEVAGNSNETAKVSMEADEQTKLGFGLVQNTVSSIEELVMDIQQNASHVEDLAQKVSDVASVLDVIRGIAEQTNLLALNAAIEAARAGEAGRGFAVVADEVRGLASRTGESTKEIEDIIGSVEAGTQKAVASMNEGQESANKTLTVGIKAGESLEKIATAITAINDRNTASASATEQQAAVAKEVDKNLILIRDIAIQTNDGAEQTTKASGELAKLAEDLSGLVKGFKI